MIVDYLLPYEKTSYDVDVIHGWKSAFKRESICGREHYYTDVFQEYGDNTWYNKMAIGPFANKEDAMRDLDERLVRIGFYLIKPEEVERFRKLSLLV